jgi:UDP-glucose 4-epimerase
MNKYNTSNLVFSSSATVYGNPSVIPIRETSAIVPMSVYGRSKGMVERIIQDACIAGAGAGEEAGLRAVSVRYFK